MKKSTGKFKNISYNPLKKDTQSVIQNKGKTPVTKRYW